jgi:hypothetical protein
MLDHLPYDIASNILSYNNYPFCNGVCKYLTRVEDHLHMERYRRIVYGTDIQVLVISSIERRDWESFFFLYTYMWRIDYVRDADETCRILRQLILSGRSKMAENMIRKDKPCLCYNDVDYKSRKGQYGSISKILKVCSREMTMLLTKVTDMTTSRILNIKLYYCMIQGDIEEVIFYLDQRRVDIQSCWPYLDNAIDKGVDTSGLAFVFMELVKRGVVSVGISDHRRIGGVISRIAETNTNAEFREMFM